MAAHAAHISTSIQTQPSLFEIIAQGSLAATLKPAIRQLLEAIPFNTRVLTILQWYDEIYMGFDLLLQAHYLNYCDATFAEAFYSLKRVNMNDQPLSGPQKFLTIVTTVLVAYVKSKLAKITVNQNYKPSFIPRVLIQMSPQIDQAINVTWQTLKFIYLLRYISGHTRHATPEMALLNLHLARSDLSVTFASWADLLGNIFTADHRFREIISKAIFQSIEASAFLIQFLQWFYSDASYTDVTSLPLPPAPSGNCDHSEKGTCPICHKKWQLPTALSVSGYVFCYSCIIKHLLDHQCCPVTHLPAHHDDLIRIRT